MKRLSFLILLVLMQGVSAADNVLNGQAFVELCQVSQEAASPSRQCEGYLTGMYEAYVAFNQWDLIANTLCLPAELNHKDMAKIAISHVKLIEGYQDKAANQLVLNALADAYPCQ